MTYLVFGGRSPIALALCQQLSSKGNVVHLVSRSIDDELKALSRLCGVSELHQCDLSSQADATDLVSEIDGRDGNLGGVAFVHRYRGPLNPERQHAVEVTSPHRILETLAGQGRKKECSIVLTTSPAAHSVLLDQDFDYHASKAAISALVRFGAVRLTDRGLRVNGVSPGSFVFKERAAEFYRQNPAIVEAVERYVPASRMATVDEIASVMTFLLGSESRYVNGQIIEIDGGVSNVDTAGIVRETAHP